MLSIYIYNKSVVKTAPRCIFFDLDNTLYLYKPAHTAAINATIEKAVRLLNISSNDFKKAFIKAQTQIKSQLGPTASSHSRLLYFNAVIELLGFKTQPLLALDLEQTYWHVFFHNICLVEGVKDFLAAIRRAKLSTCLITDLTSQIQYRKILFLELETYFDFIVTSEESGKDKPFSNSFQLALKKTNMQPENTWMIGDHFTNDIEGAAAIGITTLFYTTAPFLMKKKPDLAFSSFPQLHHFMKKRRWLQT